MDISKKHIDWFEHPKECFFDYKGNNCPAWALGQIRLPLAPRTNLFVLVGDFACELHWFPSNHISFYPPWEPSVRERAYSVLISKKWKSLQIHV